jgi:hypothetical protein
MSKKNRTKALALLLDTEEKNIFNDCENQFSYNGEEYLVLTDEEANEKAKEEIEQSLWAFNPIFILEHCSTWDRMSNWEVDAAKEALEKIQSSHAEAINELVRAMISDLDEFVEDAIMEDGRGYFIATYDGYEDEAKVGDTWYYIYRTN